VAPFEIGSQTAGSIQNVDGNLTIGELNVEASWSTAGLRRELAGLEEEIARVPLPYASRVAVDGALAAAAAEAAGPAPDTGTIARLVERTTHVLADTGALADAGTGLAASLRRTAAALGPAGKTLLALLPLL
jgi:hypothetical protein